MARKSNCLTLQNSLTEEDRGKGADLSNTGNMRSVRLKKCMCAGASGGFPQGYGTLAKLLQS